VLAFCIYSLPSPLQRLFAAAKAPFTPYITLREAVDLQSVGDVAEADSDALEVVARWRSLMFIYAGLLQTLAWAADAAVYFVTTNPVDALSLTQPLLIALSWLYTAARPVASPTVTTPYDLFLVYLLHAVGGVLLLGGYLFEYAVGDASLPSLHILVGLSLNLAVVFTLLYVTVQMPMNFPSARVKKEDIVRPKVVQPTNR
jgi:hypothetical protein